MAFIRTNYRYNGEGTLPNAVWDVNFTGATTGVTYEVLYENTESILMASNTPRSISTYLPAVNAITSGANVLVIGYGIGYFRSAVTAVGANLTVMEKYRGVLDLERGGFEGITQVVADPYTYNYAGFGETKFDVIIWDYTDPLSSVGAPPFTDLESILASNGKILCWNNSGEVKDLRSKESRATTAVIETLNNQGFFRSYSKNASRIYDAVKAKLKEKRNIFFNE